MAYAFGIQAILMFIAAGNGFILGMDWIEVGHGLNPWVAFPVSVVAIGVGYISAIKAIELSSD